MTLPISLSDVLKIFELANEKKASSHQEVEAWLDAVYKDLEALSDVWIQILAGKDVEYKVDEMLHWEGIHNRQQVRLATRLLLFYQYASTVIIGKSHTEFRDKFIFKLGSVLSERNKARGVLDKESRLVHDDRSSRETMEQILVRMQEELAALQVLITTFKAQY